MKTNSKLKLCIAIALVLFPLLASEKALAQPANGTLSQTGTGLTTFTIDITSTTTFQLDLNIVTTFSSVGITYFYETGANGNGLFSLVARTTAGTPYADNTVNDGVAFSPGNALLDPVSGGNPEPADLGATCNTCPVAPGSYFISTFTFSINGAITPGTYTIFLDSRRIVADSDFNDHALNINTITINIVPEPATAGLAVLGGVMLLGFIWRARRVMA